MYLNKNEMIQIIDKNLSKEDVKKIDSKIQELINNIKNENNNIVLPKNTNKAIEIDKKHLLGELQQIYESYSLKRTRYYLNRLKKSLTEVKTNKINDINLNRWKEYDDLKTDSLWIFDKRDNSGVHTADYWGNYIPQIPDQLIRRFTKEGDWILDPFLGCGTTLIECQKLARNGIGIELNNEVYKKAKNNIMDASLELFTKDVNTEIINGDSANVNIKKYLEKYGKKQVQLLLMHPPYWDIIQFSNDYKDLSNADTVEDFLDMFENVFDNTINILENDRYFAIVIGDKYSNGEWIPLGFYIMQRIMEKGHKLKSIITKNFNKTKGKRNQEKLWRYRALLGNFYVFKHEYILLFQKK